MTNVLVRVVCSIWLSYGLIGPMNGDASAQETRPDPAGSAESTPSRAPLLREGSALVDAVGSVHRGRQSGTWELIVPGPTAEAAAHVLTLLPGAFLAELEQVVLSTGRADGRAAGRTDGRTGEATRPRFRVTGIVYEFGNENYIMLTNPGLLVTGQPSAPLTGADDDDGTTTEADPTTRPVGDSEGEDDSAASIIRNLEQTVGPIAQRPDSNRAPIARSELRLEGDKIVRRRGRVRRTASGAYLFVFDADASGDADPPMTLLPCRLLERIDRHMRTQPQRRVPLLLTGHVYTYRGYNYLLPTVHQVPRERTKLAP